MDQYYIEEGYIDASYYGIVAEAGANLTGAFTPSFTVDIADATGYYIPDYIDANYFEAPGAIVEFSADLVSDTAVEAAAGKVLDATADFAAFGTATLTAKALKNHTAILDIQTNMLSTVSKIASNTVTLDSIINQSLQGDRLRDFDSASLVSFDISIAPGLLQDIGALSFNATTAITAQAQVPSSRPRPYTLINTPTLSTTSKFGGKSSSTGNGNQLTLYGSLDWKAWKTVDLWYRPNGGTTGRYHYIYEQDSGNADNVVAIGVAKTAATDTYFIEIRVRTGGINYIYTSSSIVWTATFRHLRITRDTNGINLWIDGVKNTPTSNNSLTTLPNINNGVSIGYPGGVWTSSTSGLNSGFIDELWITKDLLNSYTDSTITVPTYANQLTTAQQANTILLSHYDTDFSDDTGGWFEGSAALSNQFALTADTRKSTDIVSTPPSVFALIASADLIVSAAAALNSTAILTANISNIKQLAANLASEGAFALSVDYIIIQDAYLASEFALTASVDKLKIVTANINSSASLTGSLDAAIYGGVANITATASLTFGNNVKVIPDINWLPRRSVWHFDNPFSDVISTTGVTTTGLTVVDSSSAQTGFSTSVGTSSESNAGQAWFSGEGNRTATVKRTTGKYNTNIGTNDFAFDVYVRPYGDTNGTHTIVDFYESSDSVKFSYTYDKDVTIDANDYERFNFILSDNNNTYTYNYVTATNSSPNFNTYYTRVGDDWLYFRIQRVNGVLTVKMRDILKVSGTTDIITDADYSIDFGSAYRLFESSGNTVPTRIDLVNLQIGSEEWPVQVSNSQPNINEWYTPWSSAGATIEATSNLSVDSLIILFGDAAMSSAATLTQGNFRLRFADSTLVSTVTQIVVAQTVLAANADITNVSTMTCDAVKTARPNAQLLTNASAVTNNTRLRFAESAISANSVLSASFGLTKTPGAVSMAAEFNQTAVNGRLRDNQSTFESIAIEIAVVAKVGDFLINLESRFAQATGAVKTTNTSAAIDAVVTSSVTATKTTDIVKTLSSETTLTAASDKIKAAGAEFAVAFTQDTAAAKITVTSINASSAFTTVIPAKRIRFGTAGLNTATSIVCEALLIVNAAAELNSAVTGIFVFDKIVRIQANLEVQGFVLSAGRVIHIDEYYTIIVPQEYRRIKTLAESRTIQVDEETRVELI